MGATGVCRDNAAAKAFFDTLKRELANRRRWKTRAHASRDLARWIEGWFNTRRLHSTLDYHTPIEYENLSSSLLSTTYPGNDNERSCPECFSDSTST